MKYTDTQILDFIEANYATRGGTGKSLREEVTAQMDAAGMAQKSMLPAHGGNYDPTMFEAVPLDIEKCPICGRSGGNNQCSYCCDDPEAWGTDNSANAKADLTGDDGGPNSNSDVIAG